MERKILIKALVGSHNYSLNDEYSDKDYKVFVCPTFDDLYHNKMYSSSHIGEEEDLDIHDIRKLSNLFWKANINFLEVLYSKEAIFENPRIGEIFDMKKKIVAMNLPYLYNACGGMFHNKMKLLNKGTEGTLHLVEKYGYDTKQALHSYRVLDFIERFADTDFNDFQYAMDYKGDNLQRNFLRSIKNGVFKEEEFRRIAEKKHEKFQMLQGRYMEQKENPKTMTEIEDIVKKIVRENLQ